MSFCGVPFQHRELLGPTFSRVMTVSLWQWTPNIITTCWTLLQQTFFLWGYLKAQVFTHTFRDINSLKNAICQDIANVTQDTLCHIMASVPGRWQQCLDCHGGYLQDIVLKTWGFFCKSKTMPYLNYVQSYLLLCTINVLSYFQNR